nr:immunoglobulin heavy chain junction region [Macaca mulatta]MOW93625.1 immunoglobulin heavy chain junction region [Macaca mulatta]
CTRQDSNYDSW